MFNPFRKHEHNWVENPEQEMPEYYKDVTCSKCGKKSSSATPKGAFLLKHENFIHAMYEVIEFHKLLWGKRGGK